MKTYTIVIEIDDDSESDGEDIEQILEELFLGERPEGLPSDLAAHIVSIEDDND